MSVCYGMSLQFHSEVAKLSNSLAQLSITPSQFNHNSALIARNALYDLSVTNSWQEEIIKISQSWMTMSEDKKAEWHMFSVNLALGKSITPMTDCTKFNMTRSEDADISMQDLMMSGFFFIMLPARRLPSAELKELQVDLLMRIAHDLLSTPTYDKYVVWARAEQWNAMSCLLQLSDLVSGQSDSLGLEFESERGLQELSSFETDLLHRFSNVIESSEMCSQTLDYDYLVNPSLLRPFDSSGFRKHALQSIKNLLAGCDNHNVDYYFRACLSAGQSKERFAETIKEDPRNILWKGRTRGYFARDFLILTSLQLANKHNARVNIECSSFLNCLLSKFARINNDATPNLNYVRFLYPRILRSIGVFAYQFSNQDGDLNCFIEDSPEFKELKKQFGCVRIT